jgi:pimeloyl-ACP methyl ester carboxylesterase
VPVVLVHGNPETSALWGPLVAELDREDVIRLSPPGFGAPLGDLAPTPAGYRAWLASELERIGEPVDLVGHDWGGGHVVGLAMERPDLLRSWASDAIGLYHPDYAWHPLARIWQTPEEGERWLAALSPAEHAEFLGRGGMSAEIVREIAPALDDEMKTAILALYRAAAQPVMADLGRNLAAAARRPGCALIATDDPNVGTVEQRRRAAERAGASVALLPGLGHWWMTQDPAAGAAVLTDFWKAIDAADDGRDRGRPAPDGLTT